MIDRTDVEKKWSISDQSLGARAIEENIALSKLTKSKRAYNVGHSMSNQRKKILTLIDLNETWFLHSVC